MRRLATLFCLLNLTALCGIADAQQVLSQPAPDNGSCDSLPDNVRAIANSLNVCQHLQRILLGHEIAPPGALSKQVIQPGAAPGGPPQSNVQEDHAKQEEFKAREHISEAINRAALNSNLVLLNAQTALLELQMSAMNAEQRAFRRTKFLNAFLGTTVGAIGSGMQFSKSVSVQHAGDGVSVAGGAITAVFALCTADIDMIDQPPSDQLSEAFVNDNRGHVVPDDVWNYLKNDSTLRESAAAAPEARPKREKTFSCHLKQPPPNKDLAARLKFLGALDNSLAQMNRDMAQLSQTMASQ